MINSQSIPLPPTILWKLNAKISIPFNKISELNKEINQGKSSISIRCTVSWRVDSHSSYAALLSKTTPIFFYLTCSKIQQ
jgi:hypothetical protein